MMKKIEKQRIYYYYYFSLISLLKSRFKEKTIIFVKTKHDCHRLAIILGFLDMGSCELHGNLS